jgi:hypothetical protein
MNILFVSDNYARNVFGTKISIFQEMKSLGYGMVWADKKIFAESLCKHKRFTSFKNLAKQNDIKMLWLCHSGLIVTEEIKEWCSNKNIIVVGFGMSDPYYFSQKNRFPYYDIYITNNKSIQEKYSVLIPIIYNPTACDFRFHKNLRTKKAYFTSIIGRGKHPRFTDTDMRLKDVAFLRRNNIDVHTFGSDWFSPRQNHDHKPVTGQDFLKVINMTNLCLDLQDTFSPLAHRMMEYSACGTPVITRRRDEVLLHFTEDKDILFYDSTKELYEKVNYYIKNKSKLEIIGKAAQKNCMDRHNITHRVANIIEGLNDIIGAKFL